MEKKKDDAGKPRQDAGEKDTKKDAAEKDTEKDAGEKKQVEETKPAGETKKDAGKAKGAGEM